MQNATFFVLPSALLAAAAVLSSAAAPSPAVLLVPIDQAGRQGAALIEEQRAILDTPLAPGSVAKVFTLLAALESGTISASTRMACPGRLQVGADTYVCSHPDAGRPLGPSEALAHSCNAFFASVAARLPRAALDRVFVRAGLPPPDPGASTVRAALGLEGVHATPRQLLASFVRVAAGAGFALDPGHRQVLIDGLRGAAGYGTARGLGDAGIPALAKTGTAPRSGATVGLVVAVLPPDRPTHAIVVVAPGAAGVHATAIAVERLRGRPGIGGPGGFDLPAVTIGRPSGDGYEVATVGLEDYVANVVAGEAAPGSGSEALKAMAIVARTFALANQRRHGSEGFDLCTLTHCQVVGRATAATSAAAEATRGLALAYGGRPAQVFYTASCGGHTERPSAVWSGAPDPPYLVAMAEPACRLDAPWSSDVSAAQVSAAMRASGARGSVVRSLRVVSRTGSGRAAALEVGGFDPPIVAAETFRLALGRTAGWQLVRSTAFDVERRAGGYRFVGRGRGHGVGLCVEGAARLAREGRTARAILLHYFPGSGAELLQSGPPAPAPEQEPAVEVLLPAGAEGDRAMLARLARAALSEAARSAGLPAPQRVRLVFHPTTQAYSRATGLPWWTAGSARGSQVDLLPPPALRGRGLLERTVRHEMAHVVVGGRLAGRPLWAQEGAAMFLAGELEVRGGALEPVAAVPPCPADAEISPGRSAAAARDAYHRAAACFQRELRAGRRWNEIGAAVGAAPR